MADEIFVKCKVTEFEVRVEYVVDFGIQECLGPLFVALHSTYRKYRGCYESSLD